MKNCNVGMLLTRPIGENIMCIVCVSVPAGGEDSIEITFGICGVHRTELQ